MKHLIVINRDGVGALFKLLDDISLQQLLGMTNKEINQLPRVAEQIKRAQAVETAHVTQ